MIPTLCNTLYNTLPNFIGVARGCLTCLPVLEILSGWPISGVNGQSLQAILNVGLSAFRMDRFRFTSGIIIEEHKRAMTTVYETLAKLRAPGSHDHNVILDHI
jgi:hypothetical protein